MDQFETRYLQRCAQLSIQPLNAVLNTINQYQQFPPKPEQSVLNLSSISISLKQIDAISTALGEFQVFNSVVIADAFLGDDGCIKLATALKQNTMITTLDLRGNGIRSDGAISLGSMLKVNSALKRLYLEWNCLGIWDEGLKVIGDGLAINTTLETLDLRNNKIGGGAIVQLCGCLRRNASLKNLDLSWNHAGLIGGRALLELLGTNRTLCEMPVTGNEIPEDICRGIDNALSLNKERWYSEKSSNEHSKVLADKLGALSHSHQNELAALEAKLKAETDAARGLSNKLGEAGGELDAMQHSYRSLLQENKKWKHERDQLEKDITDERRNTQKQLEKFHSELSIEREKRTAAEDQNVQKGHQIEALKSKVKFLQEVIDDARKNSDELQQKGLSASELIKDNQKLTEELRLAKSRLDLERKEWENERKDMELQMRGKTKEMENQIKQLHREQENLQQDRDAIYRKLEIIQKSNTPDSNVVQERDTLLRKVAELSMEIASLKIAEKDNTNLRANCLRLQEELARERCEIEKLAKQISRKNAAIHKLKDEIQTREEELDARDEMTALKVYFYNQMQELQFSINAILSNRKAPTRIRAKQEVAE